MPLGLQFVYTGDFNRAKTTQQAKPPELHRNPARHIPYFDNLLRPFSFTSQ